MGFWNILVYFLNPRKQPGFNNMLNISIVIIGQNQSVEVCGYPIDMRSIWGAEDSFMALSCSCYSSQEGSTPTHSHKETIGSAISVIGMSLLGSSTISLKKGHA
jgi:hypothetical protein